MPPHVNVRPVATRRPTPWRRATTVALFAMLPVIAGCAQMRPALDAAAADPGARIAPAHYRPVLDGYAGARPVEPEPWTGTPKTEGQR